MCFNKTRSLCSSLTAEGRLVHNCDGPRSDAAQTSGSSVSTEVWTGVCSITSAIHFFQGRASVSDVGLGLFFPCLPGGIQLTSVRLLLFMKRRSSRLENLKNVDEFWLHSFLRDPFFSILFHSNKKKERFYGLAAHLMYFRCLWHPVISTPELRAALKNPQIKATLCYQYDEWNIRHLPIWLNYHPESVFFSGPCLWHGTWDGPSFWSRLKYVNNVKCFTDTHSLQRMNPNYFDDMLGFFPAASPCSCTFGRHLKFTWSLNQIVDEVSCFLSYVYQQKDAARTVCFLRTEPH